MKKSAISLTVLALAVFLGAGVHAAHAQTVCPTVPIFYANGYSMNPCIPSYYPGYPNITVYPGNNTFNPFNPGYTSGYPYGNGYPYQPTTGGGAVIQYNPFSPPVYTGGPFAPGVVNTGPTYYYPPAPTYNNGYWYGNNYWGGHGWDTWHHW